MAIPLTGLLPFFQLTTNVLSLKTVFKHWKEWYKTTCISNIIYRVISHFFLGAIVVVIVW